MIETADVVVVGGGAVGCAIAYELVKAKAHVALLEGRHIGQGASGVAAGMLTPLAESHRPGPFSELAIAALRGFPALAEELREASGVDIEYVPSGVLRLALTEEQELAAHSALSWQAELGLELTWMDGSAVRAMEPALSPEVRGALFSPEEGHVRSPRLTVAFAHAAGRQGAVIRQGYQVTGLMTEGHRVTGVRTLSGDVSAGHVVIAAGPWSGLLTGTLNAPLPVRPVKGQILSLFTVPSPFHRIIYAAGYGYLVPKLDGSVVVGATQEEAGFDERATLQGVRGLLDNAVLLAPGLGNAEVRDLWVGLRPGSPDGSPILGGLPGWEGVTVATGHFRNGMLLAPLTGRLIAQLVTGAAVEHDLSPFSPGRFNGG